MNPKRGSLRVLLLGAGLLAVGVLPCSASEGGDGLDKVRLEILQCRRLTDELTEQARTSSPNAIVATTAERMVDAQWSFDMNQYAVAAEILAGMIEDPQFQATRDYALAVRMLGISHFQEKNYLAARRQFTVMLERGWDVELATGFLIEIASLLHDRSALMDLAARIDENRMPNLIYAKGKALYVGGAYEAALQMMNRVPPDSRDSRRARYVAGACQVALSRLDEARSSFEAVIASPPKTEDDVEVIELGHMALGRLAYHDRNFSVAIDWYQHVPKESPRFLRTLAEVTSAYILWARDIPDPEEQLRLYQKAEELLFVILNRTTDLELRRDAQLMVGRLATLRGAYGEAEEAYSAVLADYTNISSDVSGLVANPANVQNLFLAAMRGPSGETELRLLASQDVIDWMRRQDGLGRLMTLLAEVGRQRAMLEDAEALYSEVSTKLAGENFLQLVPNYNSIRFKGLEVENRLITVENSLLDRMADAILPSLAEGQRQEYIALSSARKRFFGSVEDMPRSAVSYEKRSMEYNDRVRKLAVEAYGLYLAVGRMEDELLALMRLVTDSEKQRAEMSAMEERSRRAEEDGGPIERPAVMDMSPAAVVTVENPEALLEDARVMAAELVELRAKADELRRTLEQEMLVGDSGASDPEFERRGRSEFWKAATQELAFVQKVLPNLPAKASADVRALLSLHNDAATMLGEVRQADRTLATLAGDRSAVLRKALAEERAFLDARWAELKAAEAALAAGAREIGFDLLTQSKEGLVAGVIDAELGVVDIRWRKKDVIAEEIDELAVKNARASRWLRMELSDSENQEKSTQSGPAEDGSGGPSNQPTDTPSDPDDTQAPDAGGSRTPTPSDGAPGGTTAMFQE